MALATEGKPAEALIGSDETAYAGDIPSKPHMS